MTLRLSGSFSIIILFGFLCTQVSSGNCDTTIEWWKNCDFDPKALKSLACTTDEKSVCETALKSSF